jgi:putative transposase
MVRPYSQDLRERVIAAVEEEGLSRHAAARRYRVSTSSAIKWLQAYRYGGGRTRARPMGGDRRSVLRPELAWIKRLIEREKDLTLRAVAVRLSAERGVKADVPMLSRFFRAQGLSFKKKSLRRRARSA